MAVINILRRGGVFPLILNIMALTIHNYLQIHGIEQTELWKEREAKITPLFGHQILKFLLKTWKFLRGKK